MFLNPALEEHQGRNADQEDAHRGGDEGIHTSAVHGSQMAQQTDAGDRSGNTSGSQAQDHSAFDGSFSYVDPSRADFGDEVEKRIGSHRENRRDPKHKNQDGQQQDAAPDAGHSNQGANYKADQNFLDYHNVSRIRLRKPIPSSGAMAID